MPQQILPQAGLNASTHTDQRNTTHTLIGAADHTVLPDQSPRWDTITAKPDYGVYATAKGSWLRVGGLGQ